MLDLRDEREHLFRYFWRSCKISFITGLSRQRETCLVFLEPSSLESQKFYRFPICTGALLTRYAGDKFERSQHAYRTQRAQIHIQVYALRERRDDPAPKTHTPRHTLLLTTLLH